MLVIHGRVGDMRPLLATLCMAVGRVMVVDNNEAAAPALAAAMAGLSAELLHNGNSGGLAGAYNRAVEWLQHDVTLRQLIFLDQDSAADVLRTFLENPEVGTLLGRSDVAAVSPAYCDRATGLRGRYIDLGRWRLRHLPRRFDGLRRVAFVINSMSVWRLEAIRRIGPFNETLAIDHVDTEYCVRARQLGLAVWVHGSHEFAHAIGQRKRYRMFGLDMQAGGHSPQRRRLIGRNTALLARTWCWREPAFAGLCLMRLAYETTGIVMVEEHKLAKLAALMRGVVEGLFTRMPA